MGGGSRRAGPVEWVHFWVDGHLFGVVQTGDPRPDVEGAVTVGGAGDRLARRPSRRAIWVPGAHVVCVDQGRRGANALLGCKTLPTSGADQNNPIGNLESVTTSPGLVRLSVGPATRTAP